MKRNEIVESLLNEGFSEKTLVKFSDKQLNSLYERIVAEQVRKGSVVMSKSTANPNDVKKLTDQGLNVELRETKPSSGLSKEKKSEIVKKAKKGGDIGKKGKGFEKIVKKAKESGAKNPEAVAAAAMWKNVVREEKKEIKNWVRGLANENFHNFTSKNEIMELISIKLTEQQPAPSKPDTDAPVREKPTTKPGKPKRENPFEPKHKPKPKASSDDKLPEFLKFDNLGIKFKNEE